MNEPQSPVMPCTFALLKMNTLFSTRVAVPPARKSGDPSCSRMASFISTDPGVRPRCFIASKAANFVHTSRYWFQSLNTSLPARIRKLVRRDGLSPQLSTCRSICSSTLSRSIADHVRPAISKPFTSISRASSGRPSRNT